MPPMNPLQRRALGFPQGAQFPPMISPPGAGLPPTVGPDPNNPGAIVPQLPQVTPHPNFDPAAGARAMADMPVPGQGPLDSQHPVADAVGRALRGAAYGIRNTPEASAYSPILGGIEGGVLGLANQSQDALARRSALMKPYQDAGAEALKETAKMQASDPFQQAKEQRDFERQGRLSAEKFRQTSGLMHELRGDLKPSDALAIQKRAQEEVSQEYIMSGKDITSAEFPNDVAARQVTIAQQVRALGASRVKEPPAPAAKPQGSAPAWSLYDHPPAK